MTDTRFWVHLELKSCVTFKYLSEQKWFGIEGAEKNHALILCVMQFVFEPIVFRDNQQKSDRARVIRLCKHLLIYSR